jgi:hypothetical protein
MEIQKSSQNAVLLRPETGEKNGFEKIKKAQQKRCIFFY